MLGFAARYRTGPPRMLSHTTRELIRDRLAREVGRIDKHAPWRVALTYPSPYSVGMSSLGYQQIYRLIQGMPGVACERVFLPDGADRPGTRAASWRCRSATRGCARSVTFR